MPKLDMNSSVLSPWALEKIVELLADGGSLEIVNVHPMREYADELIHFIREAAADMHFKRSRTDEPHE